MKIKFAFIILTEFLLFFSCATPDLNQTKVQDSNAQGSYTVSMDNDGWILVNGERFFVKGVCYFEGHEINGQYVENSPEVLDYEFKRIKEAGFNTIRTYFTPEKIAIAKKNGLFVNQISDQLYFSNDYLDQFKIRCWLENIDMIVGFSKKFDNILFYQIDNEPNVNAMIQQGELNAYSMWSMLVAKVKQVESGALTNISLMPTSAFADTSMCNIDCLNLYPGNTVFNCIGYSSFANWYKRNHAKNKPFIITEYGWVDNINDMSSNMINLLDQQIKAGATGSFFYTWRCWGKEKEKDNIWWGFIPNNGLPDDYKNTPRQIYYDYQKYFEAVVIEPKIDNLYTNTLPIKIYGTDKTTRMNVVFDNITYSLHQTGTYWWETEIMINSSQMGKKSITITSYDHVNNILVSKQVNFYISLKQKFLTLKITNPQIVSNSFTAKITVKDQDDNPAPDQVITYGIYQTSVDNWVRDQAHGRTNQNGECTFAWDNIGTGYFHLMAGVNSSDEYPVTYSDVCIYKM